MAFTVARVVPVLRIFSVEKAREFYVDWLGFTVDFEHRYEPGMPLYMGISRDGMALHLSEHHGDGSPGANLTIEVSGLDDLHRELKAKPYGYYRPGIKKTPWSTRVMTLQDPFGNRLNFSEPVE